MEQLFIQFVDLYTNSKTRKFAHKHLLCAIDQPEYNCLSQVEIQLTMYAALDFTDEFKKAFFWKRAGVVVKHLKAFKDTLRQL